MKKIITKSEKETFNFAFELGINAQGGEVYALIGELGSGKTVMARGMARGLGIDSDITSPSFVLMNVYEFDSCRSGKHSFKNRKFANVKYFCHIDVYRLDGTKDLIGVGVEEYLNDKHSIVLIEWAEKVRNILSVDTKWIEIKQLGEEKREIICKF